MTAKTLLISVGGSPEPIIFSLRKLRPENAVFFASKDTRASIVKTILPALGDKAKWLAYKVIVAPDAQDIETCLFTLILR